MWEMGEVGVGCGGGGSNSKNCPSQHKYKSRKNSLYDSHTWRLVS